MPCRLSQALSAAAITGAAFLSSWSLDSFAQAGATPFTTGGVEVRSFATRTGTQIYAAAYGSGLFTSADQGATWRRISTPNNDRYFTSVAVGAPPTTFMLVGGEEGLLRTSDITVATPTFTRLITEPISTIATDPSGGNVVLVAVRGFGVLRSTDGGATFTAADNSGFGSTDIVSIAFDPSDANVVYAGASPDGLGKRGGVFRSADGGQSWASFQANLPYRYVTSVAVSGDRTVYAGILRNCVPGFVDPAEITPSECDNTGDIYFRTNGASGWTATADLNIINGVKTPRLYGVLTLKRDTNTPDVIWTGSRGLGILFGERSNFNYSFFQDGTPNILYTGVQAVTSVPGFDTIAIKATKGAGIWRSTNARSSPPTWTRVSFKDSTDNSGGDRVLSATGVAGQANTILAGLHAGGVWRSSDGGSNWAAPTVNNTRADFAFAGGAAAVNPFVSIWQLSSSATNPDLIYAAAGGVGMYYGNDNPGLFRFNGTSWGGVGNNAPTGTPWNGSIEQGIALNIQQVYGVQVDRTNDQIAYASYLTPGGTFKRSGTTWNQVIPPGITPQIRAVVQSVHNTAKFLAMPFDDKPALSTNSGASYTQVSISQTGFERVRFFAAAESPTDATKWIGASNKGLFRSADGGSTWTRVAAGTVFQQMALTAVGFKPSGIAFAGDWAGNRYCSTDGGATWRSAGAAFRAGINAIKTVGTALYYLTDGAGYYREDGNCA